MLLVVYSSDFLRRFKKLSTSQQEEVIERIESFKDTGNHRTLRVHKLAGALRGLSAFSVNYRDRIIFQCSKDKKTVYLYDIGDHSVYE